MLLLEDASGEADDERQPPAKRDGVVQDLGVRRARGRLARALEKKAHRIVGREQPELKFGRAGDEPFDARRHDEARRRVLVEKSRL